jgi:hypothetical protein
MNTFAERYASMLESDLYRLADEVKTLNPEAREALRQEFLRRHLSVKKVNWKAQPAGRPDMRRPRHIGDAAGEHAELPHGKYHAWIHVGIAFAFQVFLITVLVSNSLQALLHIKSSVAYPIALSLGLAITLPIYADPWRCIEAYSSHYCTGLFNISLLGVPLVALIYANYRGFKKLKRQ